MPLPDTVAVPTVVVPRVVVPTVVVPTVVVPTVVVHTVVDPTVVDPTVVDLTVVDRTVVDRTVAAAGGWNTDVGSIGYMMAGSAIITYGSEEMKRQFLPRIYTHDGDWVQLFSEPGAGSDAAALSLRSIRTADSSASTCANSTAVRAE